jgi:hypothetical protein
VFRTDLFIDGQWTAGDGSFAVFDKFTRQTAAVQSGALSPALIRGLGEMPHAWYLYR